MLAFVYLILAMLSGPALTSLMLYGVPLHFCALAIFSILLAQDILKLPRHFLFLWGSLPLIALILLGLHSLLGHQNSLFQSLRGATSFIDPLWFLLGLVAAPKVQGALRHPLAFACLLPWALMATLWTALGQNVAGSVWQVLLPWPPLLFAWALCAPLRPVALGLAWSTFLYAVVYFSRAFVLLLPLVLLAGICSKAVRMRTAILVLAFCVGSLIVLEYLPFKLPSRYGELSGSMVTHACLSAFGYTASEIPQTKTSGLTGETVEGASGGLRLRLHWWRTELKKTMEGGTSSILMGRGFDIIQTSTEGGRPLLDQRGKPVHEPHNSWISTFNKAGVLGLLPLTLVFCTAWFFALRTAWISKHKGIILCTLTGLVTCTVLTILQPGLENPYQAAPMWFFVGVLAWGLSPSGGSTKKAGESVHHYKEISTH